MTKPEPAQGFVVYGLVLQFIGAIIFAIALPQTFGYYSSSTAMFFTVVGALVLIIGLILLLSGISRAVGGIDYLVSVSPATDGANESSAPAAAADSNASV